MNMEIISGILIVFAFIATICGPIVGAFMERKLSREHRQWMKELDEYCEEES